MQVQELLVVKFIETVQCFSLYRKTVRLTCVNGGGVRRVVFSINTAGGA